MTPSSSEYKSAGSVLAVVLLFGAYLLGRIMVLSGGRVFTSFDSFSYAVRGDPFFDRGPLVSLTGDAPRLFGVPAFYALFPDDHARAVGQWAVGTIAWALLAWVVAGYFRNVLARIVVVAGILGAALTRPVTSWDFAILSESLSISLGVLTLAFLLWWLRKRSWPTLAGLVLAASWWTFSRPDMRLLVAVVILALLVDAWRKRRGGARPAMIAAGLLAVAVAWCTAITPNVSTEFQRWSATALPQEQELAMYRLRLYVFAMPEVKAAFETKHGMPSCPGAEARVANSNGGWDVEGFSAEVARCPDLKAWADLHSGSIGFWRDYADAAPGQLSGLMLEQANWSWSGPVYATVPQVMPGLLERVAYPRGGREVPITLGLLAFLGTAALLLGARRHQPTLTGAALVLVVTAILSTVATLLLGAGEHNRFGLQETLALRIAIVILVACALDGLIRHLSRRSGAETHPPGASDD